MGFDLGGLLQQYLGGSQKIDNTKLADDYHQVVENAPAGVVEQGLSETFRSDKTPPFSQMIGDLFGNASPQQKAGMLGQLLSGLSPAVLASVAGGLGGLAHSNGNAAAAITPEQAGLLTPGQVTTIAAQAEQHNPSIIDRMSSFYAEHPGLVKTIGSAALAIAMAKIAQRTQGK